MTLRTLFAFLVRSLLPLRVTLERCHKVEIYDFLLDLLCQLCLCLLPTVAPFCFLLSRFVLSDALSGRIRAHESAIGAAAGYLRLIELIIALLIAPRKTVKFKIKRGNILKN